MTEQKTSDFYWACRNGDIKFVRRHLLKLTPTEINQIESNGSTALHAASYYGHADVVEFLLEHGADTTIQNKYGKTAKEEASKVEVQTLFGAESKSLSNSSNKKTEDDNDDDLPQSKIFQIYRNADDIDPLTFATRISKVRLATYPVNLKSSLVAANIGYLKKRYRKKCAEEKDTEAWEIGKQLYEQYKTTNDFNYIISLYTVKLPFYSMVEDDTCFHIEMYKYLLNTNTAKVNGCFFHAVWSSLDYLKFFRWALKHPKSLIEVQIPITLLSDRNSAVSFFHCFKPASNENQKLLFEFNFTQGSCFTAIQALSTGKHPFHEAWILPGTLFSVKKIEKTSDNITIISLLNLPVDKNALHT